MAKGDCTNEIRIHTKCDPTITYISTRYCGLLPIVPEVMKVTLIPVYAFLISGYRNKRATGKELKLTVTVVEKGATTRNDLL